MPEIFTEIQTIRCPAALLTYFVQPENGGPIKIGKTRGNPYNRLSAIQVGHPDTIKMLGWIEDDCEEELHAKFESFRYRGEWFHESEELLKFIRLNAVLTPRKVRGWYPASYAIHRYGKQKSVSNKKLYDMCTVGMPDKNGGLTFLRTKLIANEFSTTAKYVIEFESMVL